MAPENYYKIIDGPCNLKICWVEFCARREKEMKDKLLKWAYDTTDKPSTNVKKDLNEVAQDTDED